jgi:hypothetical protein
MHTHVFPKSRDADVLAFVKILRSTKGIRKDEMFEETGCICGVCWARDIDDERSNKGSTVRGIHRRVLKKP